MKKFNWTSDEEQILTALWNGGLSLKAIGGQLDRSLSAVDHRITYLGLKRRFKGNHAHPPAAAAPPPDQTGPPPSMHFEDDPRAVHEFSALPKHPPQDVTAALMGDPARTT